MKVGRSEFDRTVKAVQASGVDKELDALLRSGRGGRPRGTRMDVYVAGMLLTVLHRQNLTMVNVLALLTKGLPDSAQRHYGIRSRKNAKQRHYTYRQITYPLQALKEKLSPNAVTDDEKLQSLMDLILTTSLPSHIPAMQALALDATGIQSWARGKTSRRAAEEPDGGCVDPESEDAPKALKAANDSLCAFDKDARFGYRTKTYSNGSSRVFGYNMVSIVGIPAVGEVKDRAPILTQGIRLRPANAGVVDPGLALLDSYTEKSQSLAEVINDRAWTYALAEQWAYQLRARGIEQILDLHPNDRGARDFEGIRMVDGAPHCPSMPDHLVDIARPARFSVGELRKNATAEQVRQHKADSQALAEFREKIAERQTWAFRRVAGPDANGKERWECPAQAGKRICANCPLSQMFDESTPTVNDPPTGVDKPKCCTQRTVTIPGNVTPKIRQRLYWGSAEWIASFNRRTYVEGSYGNMKNPNTENITRGWCCVVGLVKTSLLLAVAVAASNIRLLRAWAKRTGDITDPISTPEEDYQPWEEVDENGAILNHDPPTPVAA